MSNIIAMQNGKAIGPLDDVAAELEALAARVRSGDIDIKRALICYERHNTRLDYVNVGSMLTSLEAVGMLQWVTGILIKDAND